MALGEGEAGGRSREEEERRRKDEDEEAPVLQVRGPRGKAQTRRVREEEGREGERAVVIPKGALRTR
jgi:hypothetical protein